MKSKLVARASFALALVLGPLGGHAAAENTFTSDTARFDPQRFILNGLLVPALDTDAVPLRWVDPRPAIQCSPGTSVRVNGVPLVPGDLVPDAPFELEWHAYGCRPFGAAGPRFDGDVKLTVFREDWGFSAFVTPRESVPEGELTTNSCYRINAASGCHPFTARS